MAWNGSREEEERGLELSLGLPGYFSGSPGQAGKFANIVFVCFFFLLHSKVSCFDQLFSGCCSRFGGGAQGKPPWRWGEGEKQRRLQGKVGAPVLLPPAVVLATFLQLAMGFQSSKLSFFPLRF